MIRSMCGFRLKDKMRIEKLRESLGIRGITDVMRENRLRWFGHVERKDENDWVKGCCRMKVEGKREHGRPRKEWSEVIEEDLRRMGLRADDARDRDNWRKYIWGARMT